MTERRAKVKLVHPENLFFDKVLKEWRANASDKNGSFILKKALDNLNKYPLRMTGYAELKTIKGIGEDIATRLDLALQHFRRTECSPDEPISLAKVRKLKSGEALTYLFESTAVGSKKSIPFLSKDVRPVLRGLSQAHKVVLLASQTTNSSQSHPGDDGEQRPSSSKEVGTTDLEAVSSSEPSPAKPNLNRENSIRELDEVDDLEESMCKENNALLEYKPSANHKPEVVLIVDNRENRKVGSAKSLCELLDKRNVAYDKRSLSVGDFLWVLRLGPSADLELVMDYVVERKTWDDLKTSIRQSRYHEQKQRLKQSGIRNVVLLVEGSDHRSETSLEQSMITSSIQDGFLVQRAQNLNDTARFLVDVTKRLQKRAETEEFCGLSFSAFQDESRKTKQITVADCFLRQLTVCPRLSTKKAAQIVQHFPSFRALAQLYRNRSAAQNPESILAEAVPGIPNGVSRQLSLFFQ